MTNRPLATVSGSAEKEATIQLFINGAPIGSAVSVDYAGRFSTSLTLVEGENRLQAQAGNRAGAGPLSAEVLVTLDTTLPGAPTGLSAQGKQAGDIRLSWQPAPGPVPAGYNLYRQNASFASPAAAVKLNTSALTVGAYTDLPPEDGAWYYRVTAIDGAGNESELSVEVSAVSDRVGPSLVSVDFSPRGNVHPVSGAVAPGVVDVDLTVSEPLMADPFVSLTPDGGVPMNVDLTKVSATQYSGFFVISDSTLSGTAYLVFSARDVAGNQGSSSQSALTMDTDGPGIRRLVIDPADPVQNDAADPVILSVVVGLDEALKSGTLPDIQCLLSGDGRTAFAADSILPLDAQAGDAETWEAVFTLPADAGQTAPETFSFIFQGKDELENSSDAVNCANLFQVYQGDLPPLAVPTGFSAQALAGGKVRLTWNAVEEAVGYQLFRQAPAETELTEYQRLGAVTEYEDVTDQDGVYAYAIASVRQVGGEEALSEMSASRSVTADALAPEAPLNLALELVANGVKAEWAPPPYTEPITYRIYRSDAPTITSVEGLSFLAQNIDQTLVVDPNPSATEHTYVVTAVDAAGNESVPSNSAYLNADLLPITGIKVVQSGENAPVITWTHPGGSIEGFDFYLGDLADGLKLNTSPLTSKTWTDTGWALDARTYSIVAVDGVDQGPARSITLPQVSLALAEGAVLKRGIMNRLTCVVTGDPDLPVDNLQMELSIAGRTHLSARVDLDPGETASLPVIVGGYADLTALEDVSHTAVISPEAGETIEVMRSGSVPVE